MTTSPVQESTLRRKRGRPRDPGVESAALGAARMLLIERGMAGCTIAAVAQTANVGKGTIYLRWPDKESLVVDAIAEGLADLPHPDTGSVRGDLIENAEVGAEGLRGDRGALFAATIAELPRYPKLQALYDERVLEPVVDILREILARGARRLEVRPVQDVRLITDMVFGPMFTRLIMWQGSIPKDLVPNVVDVAMEGIRPR